MTVEEERRLQRRESLPRFQTGGTRLYLITPRPSDRIMFDWSEDFKRDKMKNHFKSKKKFLIQNEKSFQIKKEIFELAVNQPVLFIYCRISWWETLSEN